jgi:methyl-accepting chemotaxis protein
MKLKTRFLLLFFVLLISFCSIAFFTFFSLIRINKYSRIENDVYKLHLLSLEIRKNESNYFNWDLKNPSYFRTASSTNIKNIEDKTATINAISQKLEKNRFIIKNRYAGPIQNIRNETSEYVQHFNIIARNYHELGFDEWGLRGEMNKTAKEIESIIETHSDPSTKIKLLKLQQHEKDYLFSKDFTHKQLFDREFYSLKILLEQRKSVQNNYMLSALKSYGENFNNLVDKDLYIGTTHNEGLMASLSSKGNTLNRSIEELHNSITVKTAHFVQNTKNTLFIFIILTTLICLLLELYIYKRIAKLMGSEPEVVVSVAKSISKGILNIPIAKSSEYKGMMKYIARMTENLKNIISGIYHNSQNIASASTHLANTSSKIANDAYNQSKFIEDITYRLNNISRKTSENAKNAHDSKGIADTIHVSMNTINNQSESMLLSSQTISQKVDLINHISKQTKILALNAAVEAARSGTNGSGFAVIADEVKRLAEVSKEAADEINLLTYNNLNQSKQVVSLVHELLPPIENTRNLLTDISSSSQEQDESLQFISLKLSELSLLSQEYAASSEEMATNIEELEKQTSSLNKMISFFKIDKYSTEEFNVVLEKKEKSKKNVSTKENVFSTILSSIYRIFPGKKVLQYE